MSFFEKDQFEAKASLLKHEKKEELKVQQVKQTYQPLVDKIRRQLKELVKLNQQIDNFEQLTEGKNLAIKIKNNLDELQNFKIGSDNRIQQDKNMIHLKLTNEYDSEIKKLEQNAQQLQNWIQRCSSDSNKTNSSKSGVQNTEQSQQRNSQKSPRQSQKIRFSINSNMTVHDTQYRESDTFADKQLLDIEKDLAELNCIRRSNREVVQMYKEMEVTEEKNQDLAKQQENYQEMEIQNPEDNEKKS